jgi:hypothetical protein
VGRFTDNPKGIKMFNTDIITDVLTAEISREADRLGRAISVTKADVAEAVQKIEQALSKFVSSTRWTYLSYEDFEDARVDRFTTLIDSAVDLYFA